ncbi:MAG: DEAD-box ATP-dependent helicase CshA [Frankiales bacterium]|nr:DEAD-box ATP-dependent helicase CshA [Frankiales bacterium]
MTAADEPTTFADLALREELVGALASLGYEEPTPIQREAIPPLLEGRDLLGQAATGTGKTAAFALPLLHALEKRGRGSAPVALVLAPTRELAMQVSEATHKYGRDLGARVLPVYGGQPIGRQLRELERGVDIVVGTPGRVIDHINRGTLKLSEVRTVVLDEADEMLDMGFAEDIEAILEAAPGERQTVLFSATMPPRVDKIARRHLRNPVRIEIQREQTPTGEAPQVRQSAYVVARPHKPAALGRVLDVEAPEAAIVFCRTREEVDSLTETLNGRGYRAEALHGGLSQEQRDKVMGRLRGRTADLLVATDVAARGLDVDHLTHVVNYNVPSAPEAYVHRIGRVGRAGREGVAITLAEPREHRMLKTIERATGQKIVVEKVPTVADLQARRMELTRVALHEALIEDQFESYRVVLDALTDEYDVVQVALAAIKLAHEATTGPAGEDAEDIPTAAPRPETSYSDGPAAKRGGAERPVRKSRPDAARVFIGLGRAAGLRPQDVVGAITGESSLSGRDIGSIEISDRFALVEVPSAAADEVVQALRKTKIKGRKATVRLDQGPTR